MQNAVSKTHQKSGVTRPDFFVLLKSWALTWGLLFVVLFALTPSGFLMGKAWLPLHTTLEILSVVVSLFIFVVARNTLVLGVSQAGAWVSSLFLLVGIFDAAHLLSFPGMPDFLNTNQDAKSISFWLVARLFASVALLVCVGFDWETTGTPASSRVQLAAALVVALIGVPGVAFWSEWQPQVFWKSPGLTPLKIGVELLLAVMMAAALAIELRVETARKRLYDSTVMSHALITLVFAELCFMGYQQNNDAMIVLGHLYKVVGYFLLFRALGEGMVRQPFWRMQAAEAEAAQATLEMQTLFNASPDGLMLVSQEGNVLRVNRQFITMTGYFESQIVGLPVEVLVPERFRHVHQGFRQSYMQAPSIRSVGRHRILFVRRRDGTELPVDISLSPVDLMGQKVVMVSLRDITDRADLLDQLQVSEQRTRAILDNSADWIWEVDPAGNLTYSSQRVRDILGEEPEAVVGRNWVSLLTPAEARKLGPQLRELVMARSPWFNLVFECQTASGAVCYLQTNARPSFELNGQFSGYRGISRDMTAEQALARDLRKSERLFRHAFNDFPAGMGFVSCEGVLIQANARLTDLLGLEREQALPMAMSTFMTVDAWIGMSKSIVELCENRGGMYSDEVRMISKAGNPCWCRVSMALIDSEGPVPGPLLMMVSDVSAERKAKASSQRLEAIIEKMGDTVAAADTSGRNTYLNPYGRTLLGIGLDEDISHESISDHHPTAVAQLILNRAIPHATKHGTWEGETLWKTRSGEEIACWQVIMAHKGDSGEVEYWTTVARDIRERKRLEDRLSFQATHDALTGLPNRLLLRDRLQQGITQARRERKLMAVMFLDLDNFKRINDTLGHSVGDRVLMEVARRIRQSMRESDSLARQGGDEFICLIPGMSAVNDIVSMVENLIRVIAKPLELGAQQVVVTGSVGISLFPFDHDDVDELLRKADVAMYRAKELGRNNYRFYTSEMDERFSLELQLESDLRFAIGGEELSVHYQPKLSLETGEITGLEALVRWHHPQRGMVSPVEFIPVAERSMLIVQLGEWVLNNVVEQVALWRSESGMELPVAVNVSAHQFEYTDVARLIRKALTDHGVEGTSIELEITEGVLMRDPLSTARTLGQIKALGVKIAVDDFGTGYSSLGYLKQFPVDVLKVDRSFVKDLTTNTDDAGIVRAIVAMAHNLGIEVVAEGVETQDQLRFLKDCGCDYMQGYLCAKPMPPQQVSPFVASHDATQAVAS